MLINLSFLYLILILLHPVQFTVQSWLYGRSSSYCYGEGKARRCVPKFSNIVENMLPNEEVSTCGKLRKQRICIEQDNCHSCMKGSHDIRYLTDPNVNSNITYWASDYVHPGDSLVLTYSFHKLFEIYYISLIFMPLLEPDSIVVEKSVNDAKSWTVWHYFSKDCRRSFNVPAVKYPKYFSNRKKTSLKPLCAPLMTKRELKTNHNNIVVAFTTTGTRLYPDKNNELMDWMSATDIRITLKKFKTSEYHLGFTYPPLLKKYFRGLEEDNLTLSSNDDAKPNTKKVTKSPPSILNPFEYFAISDLSVGGRCQCFGHAGRCLKNKKNNKFYCDCQHNTNGRDCQICKEGYIDRPWIPATMETAGECKRCNCNLHSKTCRFDKNLYIMTKRVSGGTCEKCQHNTAGKYCHYCANGFYRDWSKPLSHQLVCLKCRCHPIGSKSTDTCDRRNSQCVCKPGVTGLSCNRCKKGYQQTTSPDTPCVKSYDPHKIPMAQAPENNCQQCNNRRKRIRFKKYCRKDAVMLVTMQSREQHNEMVRFEMKVNYVWRINVAKFRRLQPDFLAAVNSMPYSNRKSYGGKRGRVSDSSSSSGSSSSSSGGDSNSSPINSYGNQSTFPLWLRTSDLECGCPSIQLGVMYFVILKLNTIKYMDRAELFLDQKSVALRWQKNWIRRLQKFSNKEEKGQCVKFKRYRRRYRRKRRQHTYPVYRPYSSQ